MENCDDLAIAKYDMIQEAFDCCDMWGEVYWYITETVMGMNPCYFDGEDFGKGVNRHTFLEEVLECARKDWDGV